MFWQYSRKEVKLLLVATLMMFSGYALVVGYGWQAATEQSVDLAANTVGVFAGVQQNEVNSIASQLDAREKELDAREAVLNNAPAYVVDKTTLLLVTMVGIGLLGLILLNFYLDSKRRDSLVVGG